MFIDRLMSQDGEPLLEQWLRFTSQRHKLIAEDVVNLSTPNYQQKDLSVDKFQAMLREHVDRGDVAEMGAGGDDEDLREVGGGMLFHDGANRSAEQLMSDQAKNALMHNLVIELLRDQFQQLESAIKERPS